MHETSGAQVVERRAKSACRVRFVKASRPSTGRAAICTLALMEKPGQARRSRPPTQITMTTAEATVAALIAHGIDTIYALPGVHNDHLFDALFKAADRIRTVHTRHEQGAAYMALGAALATGKPQAYAVVPGPGLLNSARRAAHRLFDECAGAGADRPDSRRRHRPRPRPSARDPRPGRHHRAAGRFFRPHPQARAGPAPGRRGDPRDGDRAGPARRRSNARSTCGARRRR